MSDPGSFIFSLIHFFLNFINPHHVIGLSCGCVSWDLLVFILIVFNKRNCIVYYCIVLSNGSSRLKYFVKFSCSFENFSISEIQWHANVHCLYENICMHNTKYITIKFGVAHHLQNSEFAHYHTTEHGWSRAIVSLGFAQHLY